MNRFVRKSSLPWMALIIAAVVVIYFWKLNESTANDSRAGKVERMDLIQRVSIAGVVTPQKKTLIMAPYNGYIRKIFVGIGDRVKKGDPLVTVSQSSHTGEEGFPLRSPLDGIVVQVNKAEGEYARENDNKDFILRIDDLEKLFVFANAPEIDRAKIAKGQDVIIKASALTDKTYKGLIKDLSLAANEKEQWSRSQVVEFPIRVEITEKDDSIRPGMSVVLDVITARKEKVLMLRHEFIRKDDEQYYVLDTKGRRKDIKLGLQNEEGAEILEGLNEGDQIKQVDFVELVKDQR